MGDSGPDYRDVTLTARLSTFNYCQNITITNALFLLLTRFSVYFPLQTLQFLSLVVQKYSFL